MAAGMRNVTRNVYSWVDKHFSVYTGMQREESCLANQTSLFFCFFVFLDLIITEVCLERHDSCRRHRQQPADHTVTVLMQLIELRFVFM